MLKRVWNRIRRRMQNKAAILMYHQVCEKTGDPWQLAVTPENFQYQLDHLKNNFEVVSVDELVATVKSGELKNNMVAITFDDGFVDNYTNAAPLLEWFELPATFYLTTNPIRSAKMYWWDELQSIILLSENLPKTISIYIGKEIFHFEFTRHHLMTPTIRQEVVSWSYGGPVKNERIELYLKLWERIQPLQHLDQYTVMRNLKNWSKLNHIPAGANIPMQGYQIKKLSTNKLFTLGGHTVNHAMLSAQTELVQSYEIKDCKLEIEEITGTMVNGFAYPYGKYNDLTKALLQKNGYNYGLTTEEGAVTVESDLYELPRIQIKNWGVKEFSFKLKQIINH